MRIESEFMVLVHESTLKPVHVDESVKDFRGDPHIMKGGEAPYRAGSTGRVHTDRGSFYPGVINCKWVQKKS